MAYHRQQGVDTSIVRIFNTYGPRMRAHDGRAIPTFLRQALQDRPLTVFGEGDQTRSFCYVDDLIRGIVALAESDARSPVNFGNPDEFTLLELAKTVIEVTESRSEIVYEPLPVDDPQQRRPTSAAPATCSAGSRRSSSTRACAGRSTRPGSSASSARPTERARRQRLHHLAPRRPRRDAADRQPEHLVRQPFGDREGAGRQAERGQRRLGERGKRVVHQRLTPGRRVPRARAPGRPRGPRTDARRPRRVVGGRKGQRQPGEGLEIAAGGGGAAGVPLVQVGEPHPEEGGLQLVEAAVGPTSTASSGSRAVVAQAATRSIASGSSLVTHPPSAKAPRFLLG